MIIPAELVRRVRDAASADIDTALTRPDAESAAAAVGLAQKLGCLERVLPHRDEFAAALRENQDPESGLFPRKDWEVPLVPVLLRVTSLRVLGSGPVHPVRELEHILSSDEALRGWVTSLDWSHPWGGPTGAGHSMIGLTYPAADIGVVSVLQLEMIRGVLDAGRDDVYGVWHRDHFTKPELKQLGGAFAQGIIYARFDWPLDRPEGTVHMLEEMQLATGSWSGDWPPGSTDMDAAWLLDRYTLHDAALRRRALRMLERLAHYTVERLSTPEDFRQPRVGTTVNLLSILRTVFPDPHDDLPPWRFVMFGEVL